MCLPQDYRLGAQESLSEPNLCGFKVYLGEVDGAHQYTLSVWLFSILSSVSGMSSGHQISILNRHCLNHDLLCPVPQLECLVLRKNIFELHCAA